MPDVIEPPRIEDSFLRELVGKLTGVTIRPPISFRLENLDHNPINLLTTGIYRVSGVAGQLPWSVVLKIVALRPHDPSSPFNSSDDPGHWNYWKREPLVYQTTWLRQKDCPLAIPECYAIDESHPGEIRMWIEDIAGTLSPDWPLERYGLAARHLGQHQGAYLARLPLPDESWLLRDHFRARAERPPLESMADPAIWSQPIIAEYFPKPFHSLLTRLWEAHELLISRLEKSQQTVCHADIWPANLFSRDDQTVLIDWSGAGIGAVGLDLGNLVPDSTTRFYVNGEKLSELENLVLNGYVDGLRDVGWQGDPNRVRENYQASLALSWGFFGGWTVLAASDNSKLAALEKRVGKPIEEILRRRAPVISFIHGIVEQALGRIGA